MHSWPSFFSSKIRITGLWSIPMNARIQNPSNVSSILNLCQCNRNSTLNQRDSWMYTATTCCNKTREPNTTMRNSWLFTYLISIAISSIFFYFNKSKQLHQITMIIKITLLKWIVMLWMWSKQNTEKCWLISNRISNGACSHTRCQTNECADFAFCPYVWNVCVCICVFFTFLCRTVNCWSIVYTFVDLFAFFFPPLILQFGYFLFNIGACCFFQTLRNAWYRIDLWYL